MTDLRAYVETNGTIHPPPGLDWITVSPKAGSALAVRRCDELKVVFPQAGLDPRDIQIDATLHYVQPLDNPCRAANLIAAIDFCRTNPAWRLSCQQHKAWGLP